MNDTYPMYAALDAAVTAETAQMTLYCEIGRIVSARSEKGAAAMAAEYLHGRFPDRSGFSPRNLRRMREFYRAYGAAPALLRLALQIGWTQNVVILEADLTMVEKEWYLRAALRLGWSKLDLARQIADHTHEKTALDAEPEPC